MATKTKAPQFTVEAGPVIHGRQAYVVLDGTTALLVTFSEAKATKRAAYRNELLVHAEATA